MIVVVVQLFRHDIASPASFALVPVLLIVLQLLALGIGLITAALTVRFRDVQYVLPFMIQLLLYASPVAYGVAVVPAHLRRFYLLNPVAPLLDALRSALLGHGDIHWKAIATSTLVALLILWAGVWFFLQQDRQYADVI